MENSSDLNAILNQLLNDDKALRLLLLALLREKNVDTLNKFVTETEIRTNLSVNNSQNPESRASIQKAGDTAKGILQTIIAEKSASL